MSLAHLLKSKLNLLNAQRLSYSECGLFVEQEIEDLRAHIDVQIEKTLQALNALDVDTSIKTNEINKPVH